MTYVCGFNDLSFVGFEMVILALMAQSGFLRFRPYCGFGFLVYQMVEVLDDVVEWFRPCCGFGSGLCSNSLEGLEEKWFLAFFLFDSLEIDSS